MKYINANKVLPYKLVLEIMKYTGGGLLYFPTPDFNKSRASHTGFRDELKERNKKIVTDYEKGSSISELEKKYYLSQSSLYRIINNK